MTDNKTERSVLNSYFTCFKKYFKFSGRASRYEYWSFQLLNFFAGIIFSFLGVFAYLYAILALIPSWAVLSRRLHDVNKSFWWVGGPLLATLVLGCLGAFSQYNGAFVLGQAASNLMFVLGFVLIIYYFVLFYWTIKRGDRKANKFGQPE